MNLSIIFIPLFDAAAPYSRFECMPDAEEYGAPVGVIINRRGAAITAA